MASVEDLLPKQGETIAGKYRVERTLGTGGMGAVFEVTHTVTRKRFAVKWLLPTLTSSSDAVTRFIREAQVAGRVEHPNVVEIYDVGEERGSFYMVMELLQGETLSDRMTRSGKLSAPEACGLILPVLAGVGAAHAAGVIHRDLKPDNVFVCRTPTGGQVIKVLDFGISKMEQAGETSLTATRAGVVMGTPHYMAPEQVRSLPVDARTDVYALGVILYEMLAGVVPFAAQSYGDLVLQIMTDTPTPLSVLSPSSPAPLIEAISKAMARAPADRFASVAELEQAVLPYAGYVEPSPFNERHQSASTTPFSTTPFSTTPFPSNANTPFPSLGADTGRITSRPKTPLSTESSLERTGPRDTQPQRAMPKWLLIAVALAAIAVLGLGVVAVRLLSKQEPVAADEVLGPKPAAVVEAPPTELVIEPSDPTQALPQANDAPIEARTVNPIANQQTVVAPNVESATLEPDTAQRASDRDRRPARPRSKNVTTPPTSPAAAPSKTRRTPGLSIDDF